MIRRYWFFILLSTAIWQSCNPVASTVEKVAAGSFFDLKGYFNNELVQLAEVKNIAKTAQINGVSESHNFNSLDFSKELAVFINSDINRVAWLDQYQVDSVFDENNSLIALQYTALKPELKTRSLIISFENQKPSLIQINNLAESAVLSAAQTLEYRPGKGYRIQSNQKIPLMEDREMIVEVLFN